MTATKDFKLGKQEHVYDERTLRLGTFMAAEIVRPRRYDFDAKRAGFPLDAWGNTDWGNCVKVCEANHTVRLERLEQKRTLKVSTAQVVEEYKAEVLRQFGQATEKPGDPNDSGLVMLHNLRNWRKVGWPLDFTKKENDTRVYKIAAFGELESNDPDQLKNAIYLLHGVQLGIWLPRAAQTMTRKGTWDYNGESGPEWAPGSWGGHAVYAKAYDTESIEVLTWGQKVKVTNNFIAQYCDEAWGVVDSFNHWKGRNEIDVQALIQRLRDVGASNIEDV